MLNAQMSCRPYDWSQPQAYDGGRPQRGNRDKCRRWHWRKDDNYTLGAANDSGFRSQGICIARNDCKASKSWTFRIASLQDNRIVVTYPHPVSFFRNETYIADQMTKKSICSEPAFAVSREHSVDGFGPIGEVMAAHLHRADAQPDITGSVLEQELESLHSRAGIEIMEMCVSCGLLSVIPAKLCGEGAS